MSGKNVVERDGDGNVIKEMRYDDKGELIFTHENEWKDGRIVRKTSYDGRGNKTASFEYAYDERGNNTEGTWFVFNDGTLMKAAFVYDGENRVIEKTHFGAGSIAANKTFNSYDEEGRLAVSKYFEVWPDSMPVYTVNEYGEDGLLLESRTEDENRNLLHCERYTYNSFGKISEYTSYDAKGKAIYSYRYYFDEEGNRTRSERYDGEGNLVSTGR